MMDASRRCSSSSWAGVMRITCSGYISPSVGLTTARHLKDMLSHYGMGCFGGEGGVVVFGIIYIKTGLYTVSSGRPLLVTHAVETTKNK